MLMNVQPWLTRPLLIIASAARFTRSAETAPAKQFQLFQPIGGVSAIWSPTTMRNFFSAVPDEFSARSVTMNSPFVFKAPVMRPVLESNFNPPGRFFAENVRSEEHTSELQSRQYLV